MDGDDLEGFLAQAEIEHLMEVRKQREQARQARADDWINWLHKAVRWMLGVVLAVVLYSAIVPLSEAFDFIKIPVKDWFQSG
ncbi:MAG: hypothetical protein JJ921_18980 [Pseudomonadales bacterium]|nr:hypothetical protein [Pseudomonadales bacterium]MBO7007954.1 hypothetical protein [Pseudomonadales bacterium]